MAPKQPAFNQGLTGGLDGTTIGGRNTCSFEPVPSNRLCTHTCSRPECQTTHEQRAVNTGTITRCGNYRFTGLPLGLAIAPSVSIIVMAGVLLDYQDQFVINHMDDTLIYTKGSSSDHLKYVALALAKQAPGNRFGNCPKARIVHERWARLDVQGSSPHI